MKSILPGLLLPLVVVIAGVMAQNPTKQPRPATPKPAASPAAGVQGATKAATTGQSTKAPAKAVSPSRPVLPKRFAIKDIIPPGATGTARMWLEGGNPVFTGEATGAAYSPEVQLAGTAITATGKGSMFMEGCNLKNTPPCKDSKAMLAGNEHVLRGKVKIADWLLESDPAYPLTFKSIASEGYVRLCGRGTATHGDQQGIPLGQGETARTWLPALQSPDHLYREGAAQAIGWLARNTEDIALVLPALIKALKDTSMEVRRDAAEALGRIGDKSAIDALRSSEKDSSSWVAAVAKESADHLQQTKEDVPGASQTEVNAAPPEPCLVIPAIQPGPPAAAKKTGLQLPGVLLTGDLELKWIKGDGTADLGVEMVSLSAPAKCGFAIPTPGSIGTLRAEARSGQVWGGDVPPEDKTVAYRIIGEWELSNIGEQMQTFRFEGSKDDPLVFKLAKGSGLTYMKGTGKVTLPDGKTVALPCAKTGVSTTRAQNTKGSTQVTPKTVLVRWNAVTEDKFEVQKRALNNSAWIELANFADGTGRAYMMVTKGVSRDDITSGRAKNATTSIELDSTHVYDGSKWKPGSKAIYISGPIVGDEPKGDFYSALGVGTVIELPDRPLRLFGLKITGGTMSIKSEGLEITGAVDRMGAESGPPELPGTKGAATGSCLAIKTIQPGPPAIEKKTGIKIPGALCSGGFSVERLAGDEIADVRLTIRSSGGSTSCKYALPSQNVGAGVSLAYNVIGAFEFSDIGDASETFRFEGDSSDPLILKLEGEKGLTYIRGTGKAVLPDGKTVVLPCKR